MSQQLHILKCFKCSTFQVHQVKKSIKWQCKMCGDKQSVKRNYGVGTGKECRLHVQKLNSLRGTANENCSIERNEDNLPSNFDTDSVEPDCVKLTERPTSSKWLRYVEETKEPEVVNVNDENMTFQGTEVVLEPSNKRKRKNVIRMLPESRLITNVRKTNAIISESENISTSKRRVEHRCDSKTDHTLLETKTKVCNEFIKYGKTKLDKDVAVTRKVAKDSKWAQYVEDSGEEDAKSGDLVQHFCDSVDVNKFTDVKSVPMSRESTRELFSQCSDDDIDHLLYL